MNFTLNNICYWVFFLLTPTHCSRRMCTRPVATTLNSNGHIVSYPVSKLVFHSYVWQQQAVLKETSRLSQLFYVTSLWYLKHIWANQMEKTKKDLLLSWNRSKTDLVSWSFSLAFGTKLETTGNEFSTFNWMFNLRFRYPMIEEAQMFPSCCRSKSFRLGSIGDCKSFDPILLEPNRSRRTRVRTRPDRRSSWSGSTRSRSCKLNRKIWKRVNLSIFNCW